MDVLFIVALTIVNDWFNSEFPKGTMLLQRNLIAYFIGLPKTGKVVGIDVGIKHI